ncbi:aminotransferase class I/II-fold pyridoxal phosphate-dependent enzyme, partial [Candidatus Peregrinibacteria bacterium]|nr:aminotransferase class I/II-fold pyridoxal phosphate-dependent enzyme [Candidatus Peregrinibacteria bacterium]
MNDKIQSAIKKRKQDKKSILNLSFSDFTAFPSLFDEKKIQRSLVNIYKYPYYYPHSKGTLETRQLISEYYHNKKQNIQPENIIACATKPEALSYLFRIFASLNREALIPITRDPHLKEITEFVGLRTKNYRLNKNGKINFEVLEKQINKQTSLLFIQNPHFPTGATYQEDEFKKLLSIAEKHDLCIICDEAMIEYSHLKSPVRSIIDMAKSNQLLITVNSIKHHFALPGLKLAWMTFQGKTKTVSEYVNAVEYLADNFLNLNHLTETILPEIFDFSKKYRKQLIKHIRKNAEYAKSKLSESEKISVTPS